MGLVDKKEFKNQKKSTKGKKWDGRSRPSNDLYKQSWERIFGKKGERDERN
jgi:hypothetical protein